MSPAIASDGRLAMRAAGIAVWLAVCALIAAAGLSAPASASGRHAAFVLDANSGRVLHASAADEPRYPASLTKMMTLYLVFEAIEQGRLKPGSRIKVSEAAADAAPSKLGLEPGDTITVSDAVKALITKSANDVAVAVAEHVGGSHEKFAAMMTRKARALGMRATVFRNAHGLPDSEQVTTARDMATLGMALYDHFPREAALFATRSFAYGGSVYRNHNTMLGRFQGLDGIKTGYTRASGFNLVSSVRRDRRHVIGVVMGGRTASVRNAHMASLLHRALPRASTHRTRKPLVASKEAPPARRIAQRGRAVVAQTPPPPREPALIEAPAPATPPVHIARVRTVSVIPIAATQPAMATRVAPAPAPMPAPAADEPVRTIVASSEGRGAQPSTLGAQAARLAQNQPAVVTAALAQPASYQPATTPPTPVEAPAPVRAAGGYVIQIGAFATQAEAEARLATARRDLPTMLAGGQPFTEPVQVSNRTLYRARFAGFDARSAASTCLQLRRQQVDCLVARDN